MVVRRKAHHFGTLSLALTIALIINGGQACGAWTVTLCNQTGRTLTFYDVNETPPPSRLPSTVIGSGATFSVDPEGFNPVFAWNAGISMAGTAPNGFLIGLDLTGTPARIQYKRFHYKVTPGTPGADPTLQPIFIDQQVVEVTEGDIFIVVDSAWNGAIAPPSGACCAADDSCTNVGCSAACSGSFMPGVSCSPTTCGSGDGEVGPGGGTVTSPDGTVTVTFPPGCLSETVTITIEEGDFPSRMFNLDLTGEAGADFDIHLAYSFEPGTLEFCDEAELCMSFDRTELGLDPEDCDVMRFIHRDQICGTNFDNQCESTADCTDGTTCAFRFHEHVATCTCPAGSSTGTCCSNVGHFSDYLIVTEVEPKPILHHVLWILFIVALIACA